MKTEKRMATCVHEPYWPYDRFMYPVCRHCRIPIEPVPCKECNGIGVLYGISYKSERCRKCGGAGVARWDGDVGGGS